MVMTSYPNSSPPDPSKPIPQRVLKQILNDPSLLQQLSDRVHALMREDLKQQRERSQGYGRRF